MRMLSKELKVGWMPRGLGRKKGKLGKGSYLLPLSLFGIFASYFTGSSNQNPERASPSPGLSIRSFSKLLLLPSYLQICLVQEATREFLRGFSSMPGLLFSLQFWLSFRSSRLPRLKEANSAKLCSYLQTVSATKDLHSHLPAPKG